MSELHNGYTAYRKLINVISTLFIVVYGILKCKQTFKIVILLLFSITEVNFFFFAGCNFVFELSNALHRSSCAEVYYQCNLQSTQSNMLLELLVKIITEPCFNILRTKVCAVYVTQIQIQYFYVNHY